MINELRNEARYYLGMLCQKGIELDPSIQESYFNLSNPRPFTKDSYLDLIEEYEEFIAKIKSLAQAQ